MDLSKTLFILGAGSSFPYGFPIGEQLKNIMIKSVNKSQDIKWDRFKTYMSNNSGLNFNKIHPKFCEALRLSGSASIDTFLNSYEQNHDFSIVGRLLIAYEITNVNLKYTPSTDWIEYFIKRFISYNRIEFIQKRPKIISFNYDKLFEYKLNKNFELESNLSFKNPISVEHIYGSVDNKLSTFEFKIENEKENDIFFSELFHSSTKDLELIRREPNFCIWNEIKKYDKIYILGYGFDPFNNRILFENQTNLNSLVKECRVFSTGLNLNKGFVRILNGASDFPILKDSDCLKLLETYFPPPIFPNDI